MLRYNDKLKKSARRLRGEQTDAEQLLWSRVRRKQIRGVQFYRQKPIGPYIVDFYAPAARLVIEVDGSQHFEPEHAAKDTERDADLLELNLKVLRYDNRQVLTETQAVIEEIERVVVGRIDEGVFPNNHNNKGKPK